jgi:hypothetical protein
MHVDTFTRQEVWRTIDELPAEVMPELSSFLAYLRFKTGLAPLPDPTAESTEPSTFLLSLVGIGACDETDLSERDEEILATEIDPRRGWTLPRKDEP